MKKSVLSRNKIAVACGLAILATIPQLATAQSNQFIFSKSRSRLVVLLHGVTPKPEESPEQKIGFSGHARHYWGFEFIKGLQGRLDETTMRVITPTISGQMRLKNATHGDWRPETPDTNPFDYAPICFPVSWNTSLPPGIETNQTLIKDYIRLMTKNAGSNTTMVMVNTRDGSKHLMPQLGQTIDEVYRSYTIAFGTLPEDQQPQIYLVGHSFGGIIARGILANPTQGDLWGNKLTAQQRERCDYLRKRVVLIQTLASPHEGTPIGDVAGDIATYIDNNLYNIIVGIVSALPFDIFKDQTSAMVKQFAKDSVKFALDAVSGQRDCLQDLLRMKEYNNGILKPSTAQRQDGGPLVPIFTAAGRNPGGKYYDESRSIFYLGGIQFNPVSTWDLLKKGTRGAKESSALTLIESLMHLDGFGAEGKMPWGIAELPDGDRVSSPNKGVGPNLARELSETWVPTKPTIEGVVNSLKKGGKYEFNKADGEWDNDGFLAWDSAHAYHIINQNFFRVFEPAKYGGMLPWDDDNHGSIMFNEANGAWIHNEIIREAGPYIITNSLRRSVWNSTDVPQTPSNGIKVEVLELSDAKNDLDTFTQADFTLKMRVGATEATTLLPNNMGVVKPPFLKPFILNNFAGTIIPIKITVIERDNADIVPSPDDICVVSPEPGHTSMYFYFDTRTNRILGDISGVAGEIIETNPVWWGVSNRVKTKIRVTRI